MADRKFPLCRDLVDIKWLDLGFSGYNIALVAVQEIFLAFAAIRCWEMAKFEKWISLVKNHWLNFILDSSFSLANN